QSTLIVVDDFFDNAEALRQAALGLDYSQEKGEFPGHNGLQRINIPGLAEQVSWLLHEPLAQMTNVASHAKCRLTLAHEQGRGKVHIDPSHWSGILYLSRDEDCVGGTDFFRHIRTNTDRAPVTTDELARHGYGSVDEMTRDIIGKDGLDDSKWEKTMTVPMRFNRLVLLRPWLWHTAGPGFGDRPENGRLVYLMFFQSALAPRQG
ncbi:MAG TPA: DUF6445 family protein, partial [Sphingomicrobium sp.]